ncbi:hypothetical protein GALL_236200 [mine drainage metagenome]|uniref:Uncharacterized protein n=1 Tax=mine drainage metagenome TaxID=410659 RepID=A0A1J5S1Z6_9ZZZZ
MTTKRFKFSHNAADYEALGSYGPGKHFAVTKFPPGVPRMLSTSSAPSCVPVLALVTDVGTEEELRAELDIKFPGFTDFAAF